MASTPLPQRREMPRWIAIPTGLTAPTSPMTDCGSSLVRAPVGWNCKDSSIPPWVYINNINRPVHTEAIRGRSLSDVV